MKWLGGLVLAALAVVLLLTVLGRGRAVPQLGLGTAQSTEAADPGYAAEQARLVQTGEDGAPLYLLEAERLSQDAASEDVSAQQLRLDYTPPDSAAAPWTVTARTGRLPAGSLNLQLSGNVRLTGQPRGAKLPLRVETSALEYDVESQVATTRQAVNFYSGTRRLSARGLNADLKRGTLRLESSVHGRFPP